MDDNKRNISIDILKGIGIVLMVLGHINSPLRHFIFSFHMPLFFFVSGYLYKERGFKTIITRNFRKILVPYFVTGLFIWFAFIVIYKRYFWGLSLLLGNGSSPVWDLKDYYVGPLWFLMCFFISILLFHILNYIKGNIIQLIILLVLFLISLCYKQQNGLLPFDLLNAVPATICLWIGRQLKIEEFRRIAISNISLVIGMIVWIICLFFDELSMASHIYKLPVIDIIGAFYGTVTFYWIGNNFIKRSPLFRNLLSKIGQFSLVLVAIHSVDFMLNISGGITKALQLYGWGSFFVEALLKFMFVYLGYEFIIHIPFLKKIYV